MYRVQRNQRPARQPIARSQSMVAPVLGWNARDPEANMKAGYALYLDNWWPTPTDVQIRKGAADHATGYSGVTRHLMVYNGVSTQTMFACIDGAIYNVTSAGAVGAAVATPTDGRFVHVNFRTSGTSYLIAVNGVDNMHQYNGAAWSTPASFAINGGGTLNTNTVRHLNVFKRRLFLIENASLDFFYFPVDAVSGNVTRFPLGGVAAKGGHLVAMATWTLDGGNGVDDFAVFITSEGQLIVYQGSNPDSASEWALRGVYDLSKPIGKKCFLKFGGDLLYLSEDGVFPLSKALQSVAVETSVAVTDRISNAFSLAAKSYGGNYGWQGIFSFADSLLLFNIPTTEASISIQYVMNTKTGAWCRFTDWNAFCWELLDDQLYMGMDDKVAKAWYGLNDFGENISCYAKAAPTYLGYRGHTKLITQIRPMFRITGELAVDVAIDMDFATDLAYGPGIFAGASGSLWGSALWGSGLWSGSGVTRLDWITVAVKEGFAAAPRLRVLARDATVSWFATDLAYQIGNIQG